MLFLVGFGLAVGETFHCVNCKCSVPGKCRNSWARKMPFLFSFPLLKRRHLDFGWHAMRRTTFGDLGSVLSILCATVCIKYSEFMRLHRVQVFSRDKLCSRRGRISNNLESVNSLAIVVVWTLHRIVPDPWTHSNQSSVRVNKVTPTTTNSQNENIKIYVFIYGIRWCLRLLLDINGG